MSIPRARGFTLVEVLVALLIVALGLAALMTTIGSAADTSGYLRDKTIADWIAMDRIVEVRLSLQSLAESADKGELRYANRDWHYDTRYYNTSIPSMRRIVVRVWAGKSKAKGSPLAEAIGFTGADVAPPGSSNAVDWQFGSLPATSGPLSTGTGAASSAPILNAQPAPIAPPGAAPPGGTP
ncbi:MAG TPA: type II secretion system minor pseudopilin GspI [Steroidobacteraceae bacterium]|nr:type II secretion system minor pseudopilin GspI [Steroidobacteraceae bacterium]